MAILEKIEQRPVQANDEDFLAALYATSRALEMALVDWSNAQKAEFLQMQFRAQLTHYRQHYPQAQHNLILVDNMPIGRIYVDYGGDTITLLDITLLPQWRNQGIGSHLMTALLDTAVVAHKPISLHVWQHNDAAYRLYQRLGFVEIGRPDIYIHMQWHPPNLVRE